MPVPRETLDLIERFERNLDAHRSRQYHEAQLRLEFLNPFFKALGWDVDNVPGDAEACEDVIHEDAIRIGGAVKAPDYCFRVGGARKFFLEAKKPSVDIKDEPSAAYQLRRYAWSAKLPLSILSNFAEFAVYDCRVKPGKDDPAATARIFYCTFRDYAEKWDWIADRFCRDAILKGSFDQFAESSKGKRGTSEVDAAFLAEIENWRGVLARNLALRNPRLTQRELNFAVQRIIDGIIFLRICEDRRIEGYGRLRALVNGDRIYPRLCQLFEAADDRYNSGLFHFKPEQDRHEPPDELTLRLDLDDKLLRDILRGLYYPDSPYEFSVLPADILGQVYEQFLGKVIRLTPGHRARVEDKPQVKKAGGVYYTPTCIVDHIVRQTVGKLLDDIVNSVGRTSSRALGCPEGRSQGSSGASPQRVLKKVAQLRILDPACGSGSFLLGAYQHLLDWHLHFYLANDPPRWAKGGKPALVQTSEGWQLTIAERKRILLNNIFGVDVDAQAVEVTKLSLLLKMLEGETGQTLPTVFRLFPERARPDLGDNIKFGNSLIGPDFYDQQEMVLVDEEERLRVNVFDWSGREGFPEIIRAGGFDVVIGNPPWGQKEISVVKAEKEYVRRKYPSSVGIFDWFRPFVERGVCLLRNSGGFGMVLPDIVLLKDYPATRKFLLEQLTLTTIDWWGMAFASAVIDAVTITGIKAPAPKNHVVRTAVRDPDQPLSHPVPQDDFRSNPRCVFNLFLTPGKRRVLKKLEKLPALGEFFEIHEGVHSGNIRAELFVEERINDACRELLFGRDEISPYVLQWHGRYVCRSAAPTARSRNRYANLGRPEWHDREKILVRRTGDHVLAAVDEHRRYASNNFFIVFPKAACDLDLHGLCALLNSRFMTWFFRAIEPRKGRVFAELKIKHLVAFPLPRSLSVEGACGELNQLGAERAKLAKQTAKNPLFLRGGVSDRTCDDLDERIEAEVRRLLGITEQLLAP